MSRPAVFLDRDGTLLVHYDYLTDPDQVALMPATAAALRLLGAQGFLLVVVTNQSAVARGMLTEEKLADIHDRMKKLLAEQGAYVDKIYYCPYHPDAPVAAYRQDSELRKPKPGMLLRAAAELDIDLSRSWMIGDDDRDIEAGRAAGVLTIMLDTPGASRLVRRKGAAADYRAVNLKEAANQIVRFERQRLRQQNEQPLSATPETYQDDRTDIAEGAETARIELPLTSEFLANLSDPAAPAEQAPQQPPAPDEQNAADAVPPSSLQAPALETAVEIPFEQLFESPDTAAPQPEAKAAVEIPSMTQQPKTPFSETSETLSFAPEPSAQLQDEDQAKQDALQREADDSKRIDSVSLPKETHAAIEAARLLEKNLTDNGGTMTKDKPRRVPPSVQAETPPLRIWPLPEETSSLADRVSAKKARLTAQAADERSGRHKKKQKQKHKHADAGYERHGKEPGSNQELLRQILRELRAMNREQGFHEFSAMKLFAAVMQLVVLLLLILAFSERAEAEPNWPSVHAYLLTGILFQILTLMLLVMRRS